MTLLDFWEDYRYRSFPLFGNETNAKYQPKRSAVLKRKLRAKRKSKKRKKR